MVMFGNRVIFLCVWCTRTPTRPSHCFLHYIFLMSMS